MPEEKREEPKPKTEDNQPVETEPSGAGYGNNAGPQDEVDEQ